MGDLHYVDEKMIATPLPLVYDEERRKSAQEKSRVVSTAEVDKRCETQRPHIISTIPAPCQEFSGKIFRAVEDFLNSRPRMARKSRRRCPKK